jgi:tetratricopeptide (TPR) repeat protein
VLKALPTLGIKDRLTLINESLIKFSDNFLLDEKLAIADIYISEKDFDNAESILKELIGLHTNAEPRLASLYYEKAKKEKSLDKKEKHIINGLSYHLEHSTVFSYEEYEPIFKRLEKAYESLIDKYFSVNDAENAFKLCIGLKAYMDNWYEKYVNLKSSLISEYKDAGKKIEEIYALFNTLETEGVNLKVVKSDVVETNST